MKDSFVILPFCQVYHRAHREYLELHHLNASSALSPIKSVIPERFYPAMAGLTLGNDILLDKTEKSSVLSACAQRLRVEPRVQGVVSCRASLF
jgi:hypothetical protein